MATTPPPDATAPRQLMAVSRGAGATRLALRALPVPAAAKLAEWLFCLTRRPRPRPEEAAFLRRAARFTVPALGERITGYRWGPDGAPVVLLTHGWWSHAGRFAPLAEELLRRDLAVVAFDAPGHGRSTGWRASMPEFAWTLRAVAESVGTLHAAVGHSLGGAATIHAISRGLRVGRAVTLAAPANLHAWAEQFRGLFDLTDPVYERMRVNLERRLSLTWDDLHVPTSAARLRVPGLVIHDTDDGDVSLSEGHELVAAWSGAQFHATSGLGHRAVLRDPEVVRMVGEFVRSGD